MQKQQQEIIKWLKEKKFKGCIAGSCMLDYFEGADVDFFAYDKESFTQVFYALYYDDKFQILDPLEQWKADKFMTSTSQSKLGITTIKFMYNTCFPINIIVKNNCYNAFSVISSFDMDIITVAYDTYIGKKLDLSGDSSKTKIADWNRWNTTFYNPELWQISRILRQLQRVFKYYDRGYNTDLLVKKYIELIDVIQKHQDIFHSNNFSEKLKIRKNNTKIVKEICKVWLNTHTITDEQLELMIQKIKEI